MSANESLISVTWYDDTKTTWHAEDYQEGDKALRIKVDGAEILVPWRFYKEGEVKLLQ